MSRHDDTLRPPAATGRRARTTAGTRRQVRDAALRPFGERGHEARTAVGGGLEADREHVRMTLARTRGARVGEATGAIGLLADPIGGRWGRTPRDSPVP